MSIYRASHTQALLLLVMTNVIWGTTFPLLKDVVSTLSPQALICTRFLIAAIALIPFCRHCNRQLLKDSFVLAVPLFLAYLTQVVGLETTPANRSAFITSLNVILVPILGVLLGRSLSLPVAIAAALAFTGVGVLSWQGGAFSVGDVWTLGCAISYASFILLLEKIAPRQPLVALTTWQIIWVAILGLLWSGGNIWQELPALQANWGAIVYLGVIATAATTWTQVIAQRSLAATEVAIIYTLEPVFAALFAFWWLGERLGIRGGLGAGVILVATLISQLRPGQIYPLLPKIFQRK
ncbi:DMT family transporter [Almyronema epifaneia]|uniref:DMT family transporter n=1 Tax=Almyronema epifaneia S1 TaxID=2991925 RepID=A0ABW6IDT3_9CYAN